MFLPYTSHIGETLLKVVLYVIIIISNNEFTTIYFYWVEMSLFILNSQLVTIDQQQRSTSTIYATVYIFSFFFEKNSNNLFWNIHGTTFGTTSDEVENTYCQNKQHLYFTKKFYIETNE